MLRLFFKSVSSSFSQASHVLFGFSLMLFMFKLFLLNRSLTQISLFSSCIRLSMFLNFSSTSDTLSSKTFSACCMLCLNSLIYFFSSGICCFEISKSPFVMLSIFLYCSSSASVIVFSTSAVNFSSVHNVAWSITIGAFSW